MKSPIRSARPAKRLPITAKPPLAVRLVALLVFLNGIVILLDNLLRELHIRALSPADGFLVSIPILLGLTLIFLSTLLLRRKRAAWLVIIPFYALIIGLHLGRTLVVVRDREFEPLFMAQDFIVPLVAIAALIYYRDLFRAKSSLRNLGLALRRSIVILLVVIAYGTFGFLLFDSHDFHQQITVVEAAHNTIDQVGLTTNTPPVPYTRRARVFVDSLRIASGVVIMYVIISLFQPLKARLTDHSEDRERALELLAHFSHDSEDFFKLWPHDKSYLYTNDRMAAIAYHPAHGVALALGGPFGDPRQFNELLDSFDDLCQSNDWLPGFLHIKNSDAKLLAKFGYTIQKIGEEGVVELDTFNTTTSRDKYFRNIRNRFTKQGYTTEILPPPHNEALIDRLANINEEWLKQPGRSEHSFVMGYFDPAYLQQCELVVVRDAAHTIQAFMNLVPVYNGCKEANYDFLRHSQNSPGNINDFLMLGLLKELPDKGYTHFNLGICPLAGLDDENERKRTIIDRGLNAFYNAGDRIYSFSGLHRFKSKYDPDWIDRFAAYPPGISNFARAFTALGRIGKAPKK